MASRNGLIALVLLAACASPTQPQYTLDYVVENVDVVDVREGKILEDQTVSIDKGRIVAIGPNAAGKADVLIDGTGKFLMPGLAEMHAHIPQPSPGRDMTKPYLFLYLSNGITTIRGMLGHPSHLQLREDVLNGSILGPRIFTSGPSLNGNSVQSVAAATEMVTEQAEAGYDFLKLHPGIKLDVFDEIVRTANEKGIPYAGHVSVFVGVDHAIESKYASIDHVDGFLEGLVPDNAKVDAESNGFFGFNFSELADQEAINTLAASTKDHGVWVVPTQSLFERWASPSDAKMLGSTPEMAYMPASTVQNWIKSKENLTKSEAFTDERWELFIEIRRQLIKALHDKGQGLLLGSDAPQVFNVPGFSIHHEMAGMLRSGLTPLEILQSGTINPARFFGMDEEFGEVKEGRVADLILISGNPLESLSNIKEPAGVFVRGQYLSRERIDEELLLIAQMTKNI
ncbi:MAG: amidohydrolase family protein [Bacteroidota bacterium]